MITKALKVLNILSLKRSKKHISTVRFQNLLSLEDYRVLYILKPHHSRFVLLKCHIKIPLSTEKSNALLLMFQHTFNIKICTFYSRMIYVEAILKKTKNKYKPKDVFSRTRAYIFDYEQDDRDLMIEKQIARHFVQYTKYLSYPLSIYATKIINPFLNSRIVANHDKEEGFQPMVKSFYPLLLSSVESLQQDQKNVVVRERQNM